MNDLQLRFYGEYLTPDRFDVSSCIDHGPWDEGSSLFAQPFQTLYLLLMAGF